MHYKAERLTNRLLTEVLPDGAWSGHPCIVIGGGPSFKDFDCERLRGWRTIGINRCYERFDPTISFSMDTRFLWWILTGKYGEEAKQKFLTMPGYRVWLLTYTAQLPADIFIIPVHHNYRHGFRYFSYQLSEGLGHGNNSGCAGLNLALCLGADPIYLLGFDMKHEEGRSHWHDGHPVVQHPKTVETFKEFFGHLAKYVQAKRVKVWNLNPDSALECFPKRPAEEIL